eukprot:g1784.t1
MSMRTYQKIRSLGKGSFGQAWLVVSKRDRKRYVAKVMQEFSTKEEKMACFHEANVLKSLNHENIVKYVDSFAEGDKFHIVMEFVDGGDMSELIKRQKKMRRRLSEERVLHVFWQICRAVENCHDNRIMHRDIKSQNIFLTREGNVKVGDFGIARVLDSTTALAQTKIGTPYYLSPEICQDKPYNQKSDIWALGCLLYEMLTLEVPFQSKDMMNLVRKILFQNPQKIRGGYSLSVRNLTSSLLAKDPRRRPSIKQILQHPLFRSFRKSKVEQKESKTVRIVKAPSRRAADSRRKVVHIVRRRSADETEKPSARAAPTGRFVPVGVHRSKANVPKRVVKVSPPPAPSHGNYLKQLERARKENFAERMALQRKMAGMGGRPVRSKSTHSDVYAMRAHQHSVRSKHEKRSKKYSQEAKHLDMLAKARKEAFEERLALKQKMAGMGGRPVAAPSLRAQSDRSAAETVRRSRKNSSESNPRQRAEERRRKDETERLRVLTEARKEAFAERMALKKKMELAKQTRARNASSSSMPTKKMLQSDVTSRRKDRDEQRAINEAKKLEQLARARKEAFAERMALQKKMSGMGGRPTASRNRSSVKNGFETVTKKSVSPSTKARENETKFLDQLARARKEAFEERKRLKQKMAGCGGRPVVVRLDNESFESAPISSRAVPATNVRSSSADRDERKKNEADAYSKLLTKARKQAFADRMALKKKMAAQLDSGSVGATLRQVPKMSNVAAPVSNKSKFQKSKLGLEETKQRESHEAKENRCVRNEAHSTPVPVGKRARSKEAKLTRSPDFEFTSPPPLSCGPNRADTKAMRAYLESHLGASLLNDIAKKLESGMSAIPLMRRVPGGMQRAQHIIPLVRQYSRLMVASSHRQTEAF